MHFVSIVPMRSQGARQKEWVKPSTRAKNVFKPHTFSLNYRTGIVGQSPVVMNNLNFTGVFWTWYTFSGVFSASSNWLGIHGFGVLLGWVSDSFQATKPFLKFNSEKTPGALPQAATAPGLGYEDT